VRLRDVVHRQVAVYQDEKDVEGRKYNGWWSIWDVLKGVKPAKHYHSRASQIRGDVKQILNPIVAQSEHDPRFGPVAQVLKGADEAFSTKFTKELGNPALSLALDPKNDGYKEKPLPGARVRTVPYNPKKPYSRSQHIWTRTPPLSRLPKVIDDDYDGDLTPIYAHQFHVRPKVRDDKLPFDLKTKNWDYPHIPYSYPVKMVKHNPKVKNPHVRKPTPGFHSEWPEYRFQQVDADAEAEAESETVEHLEAPTVAPSDSETQTPQAEASAPAGTDAAAQSASDEEPAMAAPVTDA